MSWRSTFKGDAEERFPNIAPHFASSPISATPIALQLTPIWEPLWRKKQLDASISEFRVAIGLKPDNPGPHPGLGMALEDKELYDEALEQYRRTLTLDPKSKVIRDR